jgi:hypothetical protein
VHQKVSTVREARVGCVQAEEAADERTLESIESFLNIGADEVDIRTIQNQFTVSKVWSLRVKHRISLRPYARPTPGRALCFQRGHLER